MAEEFEPILLEGKKAGKERDFVTYEFPVSAKAHELLRTRQPDFISLDLKEEHVTDKSKLYALLFNDATLSIIDHDGSSDPKYIGNALVRNYNQRYVSCHLDIDIALMHKRLDIEEKALWHYRQLTQKK